MPNISTYATKGTPVAADRLIGTDSADGSTKNFRVDALYNFYDLPGGFEAAPASGDILLRFIAPRALGFPANFAGAVGAIATNPTTAYSGGNIITVKKGATTIGTIAISTGGVYTFATTSGAAQSLASGDVLTVIAPAATADATANGAAFTLIATVY